MTVPGEDLHADLDGGWCLPQAAPREAGYCAVMRTRWPSGAVTSSRTPGP